MRHSPDTARLVWRVGQGLVPYDVAYWSDHRDGYVRFYNEHGQPIGLDGLPGSRAATHIELSVDGSYPIPEGWGP